jgi:hypothetical protein
MLQIKRLGWLTARYAVRDDRGHRGTWVRGRRSEEMSGEIDGQAYEFQPEHSEFKLTQSGRVLVVARPTEFGRSWRSAYPTVWSIVDAGSTHELRRQSGLSFRFPEMELYRGERKIGTIRQKSLVRVKVRCDLPSELSAPMQVFVAMVAATVWESERNRMG